MLPSLPNYFLSPSLLWWFLAYLSLLWVPVISVLWNRDYPDLLLSLFFVSTRYAAITITLSSFSVCHFVFFIETEGKTFSLVFIPGCFIPKWSLTSQCVVGVFLSFEAAVHGSSNASGFLQLSLAQAGSQLVLLFCWHPVTSKTCFSFLSFCLVMERKRFPAYF